MQHTKVAELIKLVGIVAWGGIEPPSHPYPLTPLQ